MQRMETYPPHELPASFATNSSETLPVNKKLEKNAVRRLDNKILLVMTIFYTLAIGNARVTIVQEHLSLTNRQYQICLTILFALCIPAEIPANLLLRKIGPRTLMPTLLILWGLVATMQGLVTSYAGLITAAAFLGLLEGPVLPAIVLYMSGFYTRQELSLRVALVFCSAGLSQAISGLFVGSLQNTRGFGGKAGWVWVLIVTGILSILTGISGFFLMLPTVRASKSLTEGEKEVIERRLEKDRPSTSQTDEFTLDQIIWSLTSPHVVLVFIMMFMLGTTLYGLGFFMGSIVGQLGVSSMKTQLLSLGPFVAAFNVSVIFAFLSDKYRTRGIPVAVLATISAIGYGVFFFTDNKSIAYGSLYLTIPGVYANLPLLVSWLSNNSDPYYRQATSIAIGIIATNLGGILSSWSFPPEEAPHFKKTTLMSLAFCGIIVIVALANSFILTQMNVSKQRCRNEILAPYVDDKNPDGGAVAWMELGDKHPDFRYTA